MESCKRGKPSSVKYDALVEAILRYRDHLIEDGKVVKEKDPIWEKIAKDLDNKYKPTSVYSICVNNRYSIRDILLGKYPNMSLNTSSDISLGNSTLSESMSESEPKTYVFTLTFTKTEFSDLITETSYAVRNKNKTRLRQYTILQPKKWTEALAKKIYDETRTSHGFHFRKHYIYRDSSSGYSLGHCKCGSELKCQIESPEHERIVRVFCTLTVGDKNCGKRQLRNPTRMKVAEELTSKTVFSYRNEQAAEMAKEDEGLNFLQSEGVLRNLKYEHRKAQYISEDPKTALSILKRTTSVGQNAIRDIGNDPFFVHFWSSHQIRIYNNQVGKNGSFLAIDATGSVAPKLIHVDERKSKHLFLYASTLQCDIGPFPVMRQITECHDSVSIGYWLKKWLQSGAKFPNEVVCDESLALLNAIISAFTPYLTIKQYANACATQEEKMPQCFIRIDCNHFIRGWSTFLKIVRPRIKTFYLAAIGMLLICQDLVIAKSLFKAICLISLSETTGTETLIAAEHLIKSLTTNDTVDSKKINEIILKLNEEEIKQEVNDNSEDEDENKDQPMNDFENDAEDFWQQWKKNIEVEVTRIVTTEEGDQDNPRFCPEISKRLLNQIDHFVLWGNAFRNSFGYGRIPATSAPIEGEFNLVKTLTLNKRTMRVDLLVETLIKQDEGRLAIFNTKIVRKPSTPIKDAIENISIHTEEIEDESNSPIEKHHKELQEIENWKGQASDSPRKRKHAMYLGNSKDAVNESLKFKKHKKIPIIKNGSRSNLQLVHVQEGLASVSNTCAFDSLFQILFAAATDNDSIREHIETEKENNQLFNLVIDTFHNGLRAATYKLRAQIIASVMNITVKKGDIININSEVNVGHLWMQLFEDTPSFVQTSECPSGCNRRMNIILPSASDHLLFIEDFQEMAIESIIPRRLRPCLGCRGESEEELQISKCGEIIAFERFETTSIELKKIPLYVKNPSTNELYKMVGFVNYSGPDVQANQSKCIGHYTAVSYRNRGKVVVYNDLLDKAEIMKERLVCPTVLVYTKTL